MKNTHGAIQAASTATGRYHPALVAQHLVLGCHQKSWVCQQNRAEGSPDFSAALGPLPSRVRSLPLIYTCPVVSVIPQLTAQKALPLQMPLCWSRERSQLVLQLQEQGPSGLQTLPLPFALSLGPRASISPPLPWDYGYWHEKGNLAPTRAVTWDKRKARLCPASLDLWFNCQKTQCTLAHPVRPQSWTATALVPTTLTTPDLVWVRSCSSRKENDQLP